MVQGNVTGTTTTYSLAERGVLYDNAGRRTKVTFESANRTGYLNLDTCTTYTYDSDKHWLKQIARAGGGDAKEKADYEYDSSDGRLTTMTYGNGAYVTYQYWSSGQLSKISHYNDSNTLIASNAYEYDKAGNVTKLILDDDLGAGKTGDAVVEYLYDDLHRLTREDCNPAQGSYRASYDYKYWYDAVGNRTKMVSNDGTFSYYYSPRNELTKRTDPGEYGDLDWFFEYDMRGNLTKKCDNDGFVYTEYYWDSQDRLTKVSYNNDNTEEAWQVQYRYDLMGRRVAKRVDSGSWRWYFYDGLQPIAEGTGTNDRTTYTLARSAIGGIICRDDGSNKYWYHFDRLGNVVAVTDENGDVDTLYTMEAFGTVLEMTNGGDFSNERSSDVQPYHLTTKEWDADIGLYYFNARWYDKNTGRFVSRTSLSVTEEHPYLYVANMPTIAVDSTGMTIEARPGGLGVLWEVYYCNARKPSRIIGIYKFYFYGTRTRPTNPAVEGCFPEDVEWEEGQWLKIGQTPKCTKANVGARCSVQWSGTDGIIEIWDPNPTPRSLIEILTGKPKAPWIGLPRWYFFTRAVFETTKGTCVCKRHVWKPI